MKGLKIVVMDRGFVKIGYIEPHPDLAFFWRMVRGRVIRVWGTTQGLAQLCEGPLSGTVTDDLHSSSIPQRAVLDILDVSIEGETKWKSYF